MKKTGSRTLKFDAAAYHPDAVAAAAHLFAGRAEVWLGEGEVTLRAPGALDALAAEFLAEVNSAELRRRIGEANRPLREYIITQALLAAAKERGGPPTTPNPSSASPEAQGGEGGEGDDKPLDPDDILSAWEAKRERSDGT